jgi:hypothetical protein
MPNTGTVEGIKDKTESVVVHELHPKKSFRNSDENPLERISADMEETKNDPSAVSPMILTK